MISHEYSRVYHGIATALLPAMANQDFTSALGDVSRGTNEEDEPLDGARKH